MGQEREIKGIATPLETSGIVPLDASLANVFQVALSGNASFAVKNVVAGHRLYVQVTGNGFAITSWQAGAQAVSIPSGASAGPAPTGVTEFQIVGTSPTCATAAMSTASGNPGLTFGSGDDGVAVFDGTNTFTFASKSDSVYTLTRDVFLAGGSSVSSGATLICAGFKLFCNGTFTNSGIVHNDGRPAVAGTAGAASRLGTLGIGTAGGNGRAANTGLAGSAQSNVLGDASPAGGAGGAGGVNAGGAGGAYVGSYANGGANFLVPMMTGFLFGQTSGGNQAQILLIGGGAGGGGGGSDGAGVTGGGGGGGGGVLVICVANMINDGVIRALGGDGAAPTGNDANGGGGGGGGGGIINILVRSKSGSGTISVAGGAGGAAVGIGVAGTAGSAGHVNSFLT